MSYNKPMNNNIKLCINGTDIPLKIFTFPGGEVSVRIEPKSDSKIISLNNTPVCISAKVKDSNDLMVLLNVKDAVERWLLSEHDFARCEYKLNLVMPYIPYARQDRVCNKGESLALKVFCDIINSMKFDVVTTLDAHSEVAPSLINNCVNIAQDAVMLDAVNNALYSFDTKFKGEFDLDEEDTVVVSPDAGALKKVFKTKCAGGYVCLNKKRNLSDGKILGIEVASGDPKDKICLIQDDICDAGGTFIAAAKLLREKGAKKVYLYVTHGIFSAGLDVLKEHLDGIITTNSWTDLKSDGFIHVLEVV